MTLNGLRNYQHGSRVDCATHCRLEKRTDTRGGARINAMVSGVTLSDNMIVLLYFCASDTAFLFVFLCVCVNGLMRLTSLATGTAVRED